MLVGGAPFEIIGVMPAGFRGLEVGAPDFWAPLAQLAQFQPGHRGREDNIGVDVVGRLKPGMSMESARAQLAAWDSNRQEVPMADRRAGTIGLAPRRGTIPQPMEAVALFTPLFFAFGLILMIGCANVANLLLARGMARQREIGIRLSLGASRRRLVRQLMTESWLLALAAAGGGYLISRVALETIVYWTMRTLPVDLGDPNLNIAVPASDWRVAVFLVVAALAATAFFALMPALQATRVEPVRTLRGELVRDARPGRARNALIGLQVFASALLLICAAIFLRSAIASSRFDPGFRTVDTVIIEMINESKRAAMVQAIASESTITAYAALRPGMLAGARHAFATSAPAGRPSPTNSSRPGTSTCSTFPSCAGDRSPPRSATANTRSPSSRSRWRGSCGRMAAASAKRSGSSRIRCRNGAEGRTADAGAPGHGGGRVARRRRVSVSPMPRMPDIFLPTSVDAPKTWVAARVKGDSEIARLTLVDHLTKIDPDMGMIVTMRTLARLEMFFLQIAFWVSLVLGGLALLLTVSGLFSVLSYLVEQRTREIGVRMALGASSQHVTRLILSQTTRPVVYGLLAGVGLAASLATVLIATPAAGPLAEIVRVTDPIAYAASVLLIVVACLLAAWIPAARAARLDPMRTLRQE